MSYYLVHVRCKHKGRWVQHVLVVDTECARAYVDGSRAPWEVVDVKRYKGES